LVAGFVLDVEAEGAAVVVEFGADDRFDAGLGGGLGEFDGAVEIVFIGQGDGGKMVAFGEIDNRLDGEGRIEEGIVAVDVEGKVRA
jgi:hypothetical protein